MRILSSIIIGLGLTLAVCQVATADTWNKKTEVTLNDPIQVPGKVLPPGKYVFKLLDSPANRYIVQIFDGTEKHLQTTILAIPNYRLQPTGDTHFSFWETPAGQPRALRSWFYPGDNFGHEFAYPKEAAVEIAKYTHTPVPTTPAVEPEQLPSAPVTTVDEAQAEKPVQPQLEAQARPEPAPAPAVTPAPAPAPAPVMPRTASDLPLIALTGFIAIAAAIIVMAIRRVS